MVTLASMNRGGISPRFKGGLLALAPEDSTNFCLSSAVIPGGNDGAGSRRAVHGIPLKIPGGPVLTGGPVLLVVAVGVEEPGPVPPFRDASLFPCSGPPPPKFSEVGLAGPIAWLCPAVRRACVPQLGTGPMPESRWSESPHR